MLKSEEFLAEAVAYEEQAKHENVPHVIQLLLRQLLDAAWRDAQEAAKKGE